MNMQELKARTANKELSTDGVIALMPEEARKHAFVVGRWVWVQFPVKPAAQTRNELSRLGFNWNSDRKVWQHPCGCNARLNPKVDPRDKYGIREIIDGQEN